MSKVVDLNAISQAYQKRAAACPQRVIICAGTGCIANGSLEVYHKLQEELQKRNINVVLELKDHDQSGTHISKSGCQGFCQVGPLLTILPANTMYCHVKPQDVEEIVEQTLVNGQFIDRLLYNNPADGTHCHGPSDIPFYTQQSRSVIARCGSLDPEDINEYIAAGGYAAARKAYLQMTPAEVVAYAKDSGLRGRGGGGFPSGVKWELALKQDNPKKYVICNGDEGDPGAFMDRSLLEGNPHSVLEGMMIAARAIGADEGYIYVRVEYPLAVSRVNRAIKDATELGILGNNVFGSGLNFNLHVVQGAGAFVCGEETALIASIEGERGMPRPKPPYPADKGLFGKPTVINNVETLSTVPLIYAHGKDHFRSIGTPKSPGTKTFALTGHVANTGLIEVPFGTTVRQIVFDIGGGVLGPDGKIDNDAFKAVQIGGPSGGCLTADHLDLPLDFDSLTSIGAMVGSGGLVVMNSSTCIVQIARYFMKFTQHESCGKCVPCREGTRQMLELLDDIIEGRATEETLILLEKTARTVKRSSLCGLGKSAPNPVLSTLRYFRNEYEAHVYKKYCPTGQCKALTVFKIDETKCIGCTLCARSCPVGAISGELKKPHSIDPELCIKCGACVGTCKFKAISGGV